MTIPVSTDRPVCKRRESDCLNLIEIPSGPRGNNPAAAHDLYTVHITSPKVAGARLIRVLIDHHHRPRQIFEAGHLIAHTGIHIATTSRSHAAEC